MLKTIAGFVLGALVAAAVGAAFAVTGTPPGTGPALVDGAWLNALASGLNGSYQYNLTAAGSTQATATQLPAAVFLMEIDNGSGGVALPPAVAGTEIQIYNALGTTLTVYPSIANNPLTSAQDTINTGTSYTPSTHSAATFFSAKNGVWAAK